MLAVNSYPELFTTLLGWQQYQNIWDIIVHSGLGFVPFIVMIVKNTVEPFLSQEAKSAYTTSLRRVEYSLATMVLTIMIACQPMMTLAPNVIHFKPVCDQSIDATTDHSGTTYDEAFPNLQPVKVPLWWFAIMGISHGITAALNVGLGCTPDLREEQIQLHLTRIKSAPLARRNTAICASVLVAFLAKIQSGKTRCSRVYKSLWCRRSPSGSVRMPF